MGVIFIVLEKFHPYYPLLPPIAHEQLDALTKEIEMTTIRMFSSIRYVYVEMEKLSRICDK